MRLSKLQKNEEIIKNKYVDLLDKRASNILTINQLKKQDTILDKVVLDQDYFNSQPSQKKFSR